jgi:PAS domain S-box-containing protein
MNENRSGEELILENARLRQEIRKLKSSESAQRKKLQASEARFRDLANLLPVAVFEMNEAGIITYCNQYAFTLTGYSKRDFEKGFNALGLIQPEDRDRARDNILKSLSGIDLGHVEYNGRRKDGSNLDVLICSSPIMEDNRPVGIRGIIFDISGRKQLEEELNSHRIFLEELVNERTAELQTALAGLQQEIVEKNLAEEALRKSQESFYKAFKSSPTMMTISSINDGKYLNVNDSFVNATGYSQREVVGRTPLELNLLSREQHDKIMQLLKKHGEIHNLEVTYFTKSGEPRTGLFSVEVIELNGEPHMLRLVHDITDRINFEKEIARLDRLNLVGQMAAGIGHEIRNPMTVVRGFLQMIMDREEHSRHQAYFHVMIDELDRANGIISEFLSLARDKAISKKLVDINGIVEALAPLIMADAFRNDKIVTIEPGNIPLLLLDEKEIRQLILNLARNGLEAMTQGGELTIRTFTGDAEVVLWIRDQGSGIHPEILDKIGTPFYTTKENGTGLGLAVCYSIASRHNAAIKVESCASGTIFSVRFRT